MRPGKLYWMVVSLTSEGGGSMYGAGGATLTVQPVLPGATVSPPSITLSGAAGSEARFVVCPANARAMRLRDARIEFYSAGRLAHTLRTPARTASRRRAWLFLLLAFLVPSLMAYLRADPIVEAIPQGQAAERPAVPAPGNVAKEPNGDGEDKDPTTQAKPAEKTAPPTPTPARPAATSGSGGGAGGALMEVYIPPHTHLPGTPRESLDYRLKKRGSPYWNGLAPTDFRQVMWAGLYFIKDGFPLGKHHHFPGLLDAYEFVTNDPVAGPLGPLQDFLIAGLLLLVAGLLWLMSLSSSRQLKGGVIELGAA
jgi:hypothetical protein